MSQWLVSQIVKALIDFMIKAFVRWQDDMKKKQADESTTAENQKKLEDSQTEKEQQDATDRLSNRLGRP